MKVTLLIIVNLFLAIILPAQTAPELIDSLLHKSFGEKSIQAKGGGATVYWSEDFSNGFDGQDDNGQWTTAGEQGDLWFQTFPVDAVNGYDPEGTIDGYGDVIPNFFENRDVVLSPSRDNGVMMLDADRFNSSRTDPEDDITEHILSNTISSSLISPSINFSENPFADLCFYSYSHICCNDQRYALIDLSTDGGETWTTVDTLVNLEDEFQGQICVNLSPILAFADDITDCKIRFSWSFFARHFFWFLDDISVQSIPVNELVASKTWYRNHHQLVDGLENGTISVLDYYQTFEYHTAPAYSIKPLDLSMVVRNEGSATQTGVVLEVIGTSPSGIPLGPFTSVPVSIAAYTTDTLTIDPLDFGDQANQIPLEEGDYTLQYLVIQNEDDEIPENNIGQTRKFSISSEAQGAAVYRNGNDNYAGIFSTLGEDVIWSTAYAFDNDFEQNKVITHIQTVLQSNELFAETQAGEIIYFNVRRGSVFNEDPFQPETLTSVFFDMENPYDYDSEELAYEIQEEDIWNFNEDGLPYSVFVTFELPNPVMVNPGEIYQAEFRIPPTGSNVVFPALTSLEEKYSSFYYYYPEGEGQWFDLSTLSAPIWFQVADEEDLSLSENSMTAQSGIQLLQNYPNPLSDITRIQYRLDESSDVTFEVFDLSGRLIYSEDHGRILAGTAQTFEFDARSLSPGIYTYSIAANGKRATRKFAVE